METPIQLTADYSCESMEARGVSSAKRNSLPSAKSISRGKYPSGMNGKYILTQRKTKRICYQTPDPNLEIN